MVVHVYTGVRVYVCRCVCVCECVCVCLCIHVRENPEGREGRNVREHDILWIIRIRILVHDTSS